MVMMREKRASKPLTIANLRELLTLADIRFTCKDKLADLRRLCEDNGLIDKPFPSLNTVERHCVVKCGLNKVMNLNDDDFGKFRDHIDELVNIISRMLRRSSLALAFHLTRLAQNNLPIPNLYNMKDTYWKDWLKIGVNEVFPDEASKASYSVVKDVIGMVIDTDAPDYIHKYPIYFDQVLNYAGHTFSTVVSNNAWVPLFARLARLTGATLKDLKAPQKTYTVMQAIRRDDQDMEGWSEDVKAYVQTVRSMLGVKPGTRMHDSYGKDNVDFPTMFMFNYWMQTRFEALKQRRLRLMPFFNVHRAHIRLDLKTLVNLFRHMFPDHPAVAVLADCDEAKAKNPDRYMLPEKPPVKKKKESTPDEWNEYKRVKDLYDEEVRKIKGSEVYAAQKARHSYLVSVKKAVATSFFGKLPTRKGWEFDCSISTDGVSVGLQYSKLVQVPANASKTSGTSLKETSVAPDYDRALETSLPDLGVVVLGVDPGRSNMATSTYLVDGKSKTWKLSRGAYYHRSGIKSLERQRGRRFTEMTPHWVSLQGEGVALSTSNPDELYAYLSRYITFSDDWWRLALRRRESRDNFQRYIGKRKVMDTFWASIKRDMNKAFPDMTVHVAYGSAVVSMKPAGPGEAAVPTGAMFASCNRIFEGNVSVTDEFRTTMMSWETGTKKELVYKIPSMTRGRERFGHTSSMVPPAISEEDKEAVRMYCVRKDIQSMHRKGGLASSVDVDRPLKRYPEVRGLRFSPETRMYLDRDRAAALTIARLLCMELRGRGRPLPFHRSCAV